MDKGEPNNFVLQFLKQIIIKLIRSLVSSFRDEVYGRKDGCNIDLTTVSIVSLEGIIVEKSYRLCRVLLAVYTK
jgi:hypothetical protein